MSIFLNSAQRFWMPGLTGVKADSLMTITSWLDESKYYIKEMRGSGSFTIQFSDEKFAAKLFAVTADRTASNCCESIVSIAEVQRSPKSVAWLLIMLYYSAFFGAHSHMRTCGFSCANLDAVDSAKIFETAKLYGISGNTQKIANGLYDVKWDSNDGEMTFESLSSTGSHEALWSAYLKFLNNLELRAVSSINIDIERRLFINKINDLKKVLTLHGSNGGNWLSRFRNILQYRQGYGAWYPYYLSKSVSSKLHEKVMAKFLSNPDDINILTSAKSIDDQVKCFIDSTTFLSSFTRASSLEIARRSTIGKSVSKEGCANLLKRAKMA